MPCPVCHGQMVPYVAPWLRRCSACGFLSSSLVPAVLDEGMMEQIDEPTRLRALKDLRHQNFRQILGLLKSARPYGRLLDIGCAHGWFVQMASEAGYQAEGIEPDPHMFEIAKQAGVKVRSGFFPQDLQRDERFDVIAFNDVFEHLPDIEGAIDACAQHLSSDGVLLINIPSSSGPFYRAASALMRVGIAGPFERMWQKNFASPHLSYFNPKQLQAFAARHGFAEVAMAPLGSAPVSGLWQRLRYDRSAGLIASIFTWCAVVAATPLLRVFPSDTNVHIFNRLGRQ